jgi:ADP-heptose:LPS heptosyltransferase
MKILLIQLRQLGDVLLTSSLSKVIKEHFPHYTVHFLTLSNAKSLVSDNPYIDSIHLLEKGLLSEIITVFKVRKQNYDVVIDIQRTSRSNRIVFFSNANQKIAAKKRFNNFYYNRLIEIKQSNYALDEKIYFLNAIGIKPQERYLPEIYLNRKSIENALLFMERQGIKEENYFVVAPTARRVQKTWAAINFGIVTREISKMTGLTPLVIYAPDESDKLYDFFSELKGIGFINACGQGFQEIALLIQKSRFFIGNDSFLSHLSVTQKKLSFVLMGSYFKWFPDLDFVHKIYAGLMCQPCNNWRKCPYELEDGKLRCVNILGVEKVIDRIKREIRIDDMVQ